MKKNDILCAVDFSESSMDALNLAFDMARKDHSTVIVMYCYRLIAPVDDEGTTDLKRKIEEEASRKFREFEAAHLDGQSVSYKFIMEVGFYHFRIELFLQNHPVRLLVISNSIVENFDEYKNLGFDKFVKSAQVPIVIVPHERDVSVYTNTVLK